MQLIGHGIDLVEVARIRHLFENHRDRFLDRCFTPNEQQYCNGHQKRFFEHLAGRFAAKEAILKVLGTGWRGAIAWTDIEISNEKSGKPMVTLTGECQRLAEKMKIDQWSISITHVETYATASAIGLSA